jgi:hypothetical protein
MLNNSALIDKLCDELAAYDLMLAGAGAISMSISAARSVARSGVADLYQALAFHSPAAPNTPSINLTLTRLDQYLASYAKEVIWAEYDSVMQNRQRTLLAHHANRIRDLIRQLQIHGQRVAS